jgi:hypothetical protein
LEGHRPPAFQGFDRQLDQRPVVGRIPQFAFYSLKARFVAQVAGRTFGTGRGKGRVEHLAAGIPRPTAGRWPASTGVNELFQENGPWRAEKNGSPGMIIPQTPFFLKSVTFFDVQEQADDRQ